MRFTLVFVLAAALFASGCVTKVGFASHAPYSSDRYIDRPLLVLLPADIDEQFEKATTGPPYNPMYFRVFHGQALRHELEARWRGAFSEVAVATSLEHDIAIGVPLDPPATTDEKETKKWEARYEAAKKKADFLPALVTEQRGYLLTFDSVRFSLADGMPVYAADVRLTDRESGRELFDGPMRARAVGPRIAERTARNHQERVIRDATVVACTELLRNLTVDVFDALEKAAPKAPAGK